MWVPADDEADAGPVRNVRTGELAQPDDVRARPGRHMVVEYVEAAG